MNTTNLIRLLVLAAIWGDSFLFMRIAVPALGPAVLIEYRVASAAVEIATSPRDGVDLAALEELLQRHRQSPCPGHE